MMRKVKVTLLVMLAVFAAGVFTVAPVRGHDNTPKTLTFAMPPCPIKQATVPPTKVAFMLPNTNPLGVPVTVTGSVQITDQTGSTVILTSNDVEAKLNNFFFTRTVKTLQHATGSLTFDKGCTKTDPYGSYNCTWTWGQPITAAFQGALQEDLQAGKLIVDLKIDGTIPVQFSCPVCGASCTINIPKQVDDGKGNELWVLLFGLIRLPLGLTNVFAH
jgi:hypothetical protein